MKKVITLLTAFVLSTAVVPFAGAVTANAEDFTLEILSADYYDQEVDWNLWDKFLKYDLCITDYDSLTDEEKELCRFIFETERSASGTVRCERARRILAGDSDLGERITAEELDGLPGIYDKYYTKEAHAHEYYRYIYCNYRHCVPDIMHIDSDIGVNEYWLDESGGKRILCGGFAATFADYQNYCYCELNAADQKWTSKEIEKGNIDAEAELINVDGINYTILSDDTASVVKIDYNTFGSELISEPLVIPETINGHTVTSIEISAFGATGFTEIELPESITYIGPMAFYNCRYMEKINLPENLQFMGEYAFQNTSTLSQIEINCPELVIPSFAFLHSGLSEVNLNAAKTDSQAFKGCDKLEKVVVGKDVDVIAANDFEDCTAIAEVDMSYASANIGEGAFYSSAELDSVTIPKEVEIIGALPEAQGLVMFSGFEPIPATDPLTDDPVCVFGSDCIINGWYNTEAHRYALEWGLKFNALDELEYGDANQDGSINISDAVVLQNYLLRGDSVGYEADLNKDGIIDVFDMINMRSTLVINH